MTNTDIVARLIERANRNYGTSAVAVWNPLLREAAKEIKTLRAERDEARRKYCRAFTDLFQNPAHENLSLEEAAAEVANEFGWDCFPKPDPADLEADAQ